MEPLKANLVCLSWSTNVFFNAASKTEGFDFWQYYKDAAEEMLKDDHHTILTSDMLSDTERRQEQRLTSNNGEL